MERQRESIDKKRSASLNLFKHLESRPQMFYRDVPHPKEYSKINEELRRAQADTERIRNESLRQDIIHKRNTLAKLFTFLTYETIAIFVFSFFQAISWPVKFHLEEWSFRILVGSTISQITIMLLVAVKHLFPEQNKK